MADNYVQLRAEGSGKKKRTQTHTVNSQEVHSDYAIVTDEATDVQSRVLNAEPGVSDYGQVVRVASHHLTNRVYKHWQVIGLTGNTTEALQTLTPVTGFTADSTASTFIVTSGKTLCIQNLTVMNRSDAATAFWVRANLRVNTGGTVTASSPIAHSVTLPYRSVAAAAANFGSFDEGWIPGGLWVPAGASYGISFVSASGTAARLKCDIYMYGYEFG